MKKLLLLSILIISSCANTNKKVSPINLKDISNYKISAAKLVAQNKSKASKEKLKSMSMDLIELAKPILMGFKKKHQKCTDLMDLIINRAEVMTKLSLEEIEEQYHDGSALPESPDICFEPKELVVHPATVAIITSKKSLNTESRSQINDEIEEVLAHMDVLTDLN